MVKDIFPSKACGIRPTLSNATITMASVSGAISLTATKTVHTDVASGSPDPLAIPSPSIFDFAANVVTKEQVLPNNSSCDAALGSTDVPDYVLPQHAASAQSTTTNHPMDETKSLSTPGM